MRFSLLTLLLPVTGALASPFVLLEERAAKDQSAQVKKNLTQTRMDVIAENNTLNEFGNNAQPNFFQAAALQAGGDQIETDLNQTIKTIQRSAAFTKAESTQIYNLINNQVFPATQDLLNNFIRHYPGLNKQGLSGAVATSLKQQKATVQKQSKALIAKSTGPAKQNGPALTQKFVKAFNKAINVYTQ